MDMNAPKQTADFSHLLITNAHGQPKSLLANAITWFRRAPEYDGVLRYDSFAMRTMAAAPPPWEAGRNDFEPREWTPRDDVLAANDLQLRGLSVGVDTVQTAIETVAQDHPYHPVRDYFDGIGWDRQPRLGSLLASHFGAEPSAYTQAVGEKFMVSAVARIQAPGCKADHVPVIEGLQGIGKSRAIRTISEPWFTDEISDFGSKDAAMQMRSAWFIEISELDAMSRSEVGRIKAFLSRTTDRFRPPYGRRVIEAPRQCVFVGSTNADSYLRDETGGRRFWPVRAGHIDLDALARDRDQLWAEATHLYKQGTPWWLGDADISREAARVQADRQVDDPWLAIIAEHLANQCISDTSVNELLAFPLGLKLEDWGQVEMNRVARILRVLGFERQQVRTDAKREWRYRCRQ